jgi:hypothetical protein
MTRRPPVSPGLRLGQAGPPSVCGSRGRASPAPASSSQNRGLLSPGSVLCDALVSGQSTVILEDSRYASRYSARRARSRLIVGPRPNRTGSDSTPTSYRRAASPEMLSHGLVCDARLWRARNSRGCLAPYAGASRSRLGVELSNVVALPATGNSQPSEELNFIWLTPDPGLGICR